MIKKITTVALSVSVVASLFVSTAQAEPPAFVGNVRQLDPGMHPVVVSPMKAGDLASNSIGGALANGKADTTPITYTYNNPVLNTPKVQLIWYGSWKQSPAASSSAPASNDYFNFVNTFVQDYAANARWGLNKAYYSAANASTRTNIGNLTIAGNKFISRNDTKYGKTLSQSSILKIATDSLSGAAQDNSTIYLVLTSADVAVSGFNAGNIQFCGWHSAVSSSNSMKYGFVGDSAKASWCQGQTGATPNGNIGADSMISVLAHEIEEAATDPYVTGVVWRDAGGKENADKCAWTWGTTYSVGTSGAQANWAGVSGNNYLIQQGFKLGTVTAGSGKDTWSGTCSNS